MSTAEMKATILRYVDEDNEEKITQMYASVAEDEIIGYNIDGTPVFAKAFKKEAKEMRARIKEGEFVTIEELKKEIKTW